MSQTTKAWKDPVFRATLSPAELSAIPASPVGIVEITDNTMDDVAGGTWNTAVSCYTCVTCTWMSSCRTCFTCSGWPC